MIKNLRYIYHHIMGNDNYYSSIFFSYDIFKKYKYYILFLLLFLRKYKIHIIYRIIDNNKYVVVAFKLYEKNVKRRTIGLAKKMLNEEPNKCCIFCETPLNDNNVSCEHIVPLSKGGTNSKYNITICCKKCNNTRGSENFVSYLKKVNKKYKNKKTIFI